MHNYYQKQLSKKTNFTIPYKSLLPHGKLQKVLQKGWFHVNQ